MDKKAKLTEEEQALLPFIEEVSKSGVAFSDAIDMTLSNLERKGYVKIRRALSFGSYKVKSVTVKSKTKNKRDFTALAEEMIKTFPRGTKDGTAYLWRLSLPATVKRLEQLVDKSHIDFTDEEAIRATKAYVNSFGSNRGYMRILKYFIFKETEQLDSDLLAWIDNTKDLTDEELEAQAADTLTNENFL